MLHGIKKRDATADPLVDVIDHDQGVVHNHTRHGENPEEGEVGGSDVHDDVTQQGADDTKRNDDQDVERLQDGLEGDREEGKESKHESHTANDESLPGLLRLGHGTGEDDVEVFVVTEQVIGA